MQTSVTQSQEKPTSITVDTDKLSYSMGDAIVISGTVNPPIAGIPLTIIILDPNYLLLQAERISVLPDGSFKTIITTSPDMWNLNGTYTVSAQYGPSNLENKTTFYFAPS